jgi:hypothetical protein
LSFKKKRLHGITMGCKGFVPSSVIPAEARHMSRARQMLEALLIMIIQTIIPAKKAYTEN